MDQWWIPPGGYAVPAPRPYRSAALRADLLTAFLLMLVAVNLLDILNDAIDLPAYTGLLGSLGRDTHLLWTADRNTVVAFSWLLAAFPGCAVMTCLWVHGVVANLRVLGTPASTSPAMAVGWFFIPVANLWKPFQVMSEIWRLTMKIPAAGLLGAWWACWLSGSVIGSFSFWLSFRETSDPASHLVPIAVSAVSDLLFIAAALLLLRITRTVTRAQDAAAAEAPSA